MKDVLVFSRVKFGKYARANYSEKDAKIVIKLSWGWIRKCEGLTPEEMNKLGYSYDDRWFVKKSELREKK